MKIMLMESALLVVYLILTATAFIINLARDARSMIIPRRKSRIKS